uniref:COesterase domain-containing protein n=1 Tax=Macrostomum lignano TaxID=282301 RepID=A0A1I8H5P7_9PLAT
MAAAIKPQQQLINVAQAASPNCESVFWRPRTHWENEAAPSNAGCSPAAGLLRRLQCRINHRNRSSDVLRLQVQWLEGERLRSKRVERNSPILSIPYAQPPTENRRFAKPEALDFSRDVQIDAKEQPPLCPQDNSTKSLPYSEDCLYMNIWSPDTTSGTKYPVLVYIHGGRFETGGIAEPEYQGETLVRNQNIVFRLALKTITDMISAFGGDPNRITLAGHGTGSASVGFHIATQDVPVTRAVMMGGSHLMPLVWSNDIDAVRGVSERFANIQLNCARGEGKLQEVIECLRNDISIEKLIEEQKNYEKLYISLEFMPVLDKEFFNFMDPLITWGERRKNVTLLMGVTADSGIEFALNSLRTRNLTTDILNRDVYYELSHTEWNDAQNKELLLKKWSEALGDFSFLCPTLYALFDDDRPQPGEDMNAYLYYFGAPDPFRDNEAPGHVNDVRYFLGVPDGPGLPYPSEHNELAKRMMEDLANFVTTGRPNNNWRSVIAGDWNYNSYLPVQDPGLYDLTGGFAIRRCRWWYDTLSFVNRLVPGDSAKPMSPLRQDPFLLDGSTIGAAPARSKPQQEAAANNFQPTSAQIIDNATVELTEVGATVRGHRLSANGKEIERFLGIPYAQPPTGDLRFAKPALKDIANATIDAQTMPKACPQAWNTTLEEDEDCLYLNIWTPRPSLTANESQQVPVLVYIHGGFFEVGGINDPYRSGEKIVELQDVVVVTIGYRLGVLGFLPFSAEGSRGNFGLFDQEMALKWVEANIHHFGGNASLITAVGDDAGAVSIGYHLIRNETRISRVILQTGSPSMAYPLNNDTDGTRMRIEQYLQLMGCNNSTTDAQLACMRAKSVSDINSVYTNEFANKFGPEALVTVDGDFLKEDPWHSVQQGDMSQVPMIVGFVDRPGNEIINRRIRFGELDLANISYDEVLQNIVNASYYNPRLPKELKQPGATLIGMQYRPPLLHRQVLIDSLSEAYSDRFYTCGNNEYLQQVISKRHPLDAFLYHYVFSEKSNVENITSDGASLSEDTFYLFGNPLQGPEWNDEQKSLSEKMIELFTHFAETGNPNPENSLDLWWEYTANLKPYLVLDAQVHNVSVNWGFRINDCGFWQEVLPYVNELKEPPEPTRPPIGPEGEIIDEIIIEIDLGRTQNRISIAGDVVRLANGKIIKRFLGLPYAEMPLTRWSYASFPKGGNYTAKSMPPACPQTINPVPERSMSEDCLYINVFFPNDTSTTYPTVVFLHGGNYTSGANSLPEYRGEQLLENEDVILITVNYRLGALGFLFLDDEKLPGNFGLMDQRLALDFIQRVIPFFGGSRTQITLMGHGTDAASAGFHAVTDSKDFFDRMILMGGSPSMPLAWSSSTQKIVELQFNYFPRFPERNTATGIQFLKLALTEWNYYDYNKRIKAIWSRAMGDFNFLCPIWEATSDLLRAKQHDIHMYYIDVEDPLRVQEDLIGADHWGDIRYLFGEPLRKDLYPEVHKNLSRLMMHDFVQYIGGSAPSHWNATSQETSDFLLYDILQTDSGGPGNLVSVMVPDGFGLNTGRCPLWKNELPYVKSFVSAPFQEEETSKITVSASRKRPAIGKTSSVKDESEFNLYEVVSNYTVDVPGFGKVTGQTIMTLSNNITMSQFLGVRYAQPPVGNRRLAKPVKPHTTSDSKHLALTMPPMCIQREHHNRNMSEDCLYLNIWTPRRAGRNVNDIPCLFLFMEAFLKSEGSMILDHYDAVVVTMNYRLGAFGFLSLDNKEWVADNIESFGGNKNRITLMGVEAGAVSIGYHMARPKQNRFHQVVLMTGSPYMSYPLSDDIEEVRDLQYSFLRRLRCPVDPAEALECIRSQPADSINEQQDVFQQLFQRLEFPPIIDGDFIRLDPWTMDPSTLMQVPMIFGGVDRPGNTFIERLVDTEILVPENFSHNAYLTILQSMNEFFPRYPKSMTVSGRTGLRNHFMQYNGQGNFERDLRDLGLALSDRYFTCANNKFLDAYSKASGKPVYNYLFTEGKEYKGDTELPLQHASLFEDAFYVFGNPSSPGPIVPDQQRRLSDAIMHAIVQFARTGRPSDLLKWDPYDSEKKSHLLLDADHLPPTMYPDGYRRQECGFWDHTLPFVNSLNDTAPPPTRPPIGPDGGIIEEIIIEIDLGRTQNRISIAGDLVRLPNGKIIKRFLGLPYAEMPLTRWSQASLPKGGNYTAKTMPPACPQTINPVPGGSMSEDCLYLNIWAPRDTSRSYPTAVFLHGGNYTSGANSLPEYRGEQLLENEDVILITVNYRLGALGFLFLDDEKLPGNFGLMDQRLALDFIQRVIPFFGGSRTQITLMGHGTDAASAGFHAVTDSKDFFDRMILMGGSPSMPLAWSSSTQEVLEDSEHFV